VTYDYHTMDEARHTEQRSGCVRGHELMGRALASIDGIYDEHGVGKRNTCGAVGAHSRILLEEVSFNR